MHLFLFLLLLRRAVLRSPLPAQTWAPPAEPRRLRPKVLDRRPWRPWGHR